MRIPNPNYLMDMDLQTILQDGGLLAEHSIPPAPCALCRRIIVPDIEVIDNLEAISICGDCKFLLLEDLGTPTRGSHSRRSARGRRTRYSSSESVDDNFSRRFSHIISLVGQSQSPVSGYEDQFVDGDASARVVQQASYRTTPNGSRRWRRVLSDTESDGFDNLDSFYGDSDSNISFGRYRVFHGESDEISFSAYGGDSDASVDARSVLDTDVFIQPDEETNLDSDTDIDPMHAGPNRWYSDDSEEEDEEEDGGWEADVIEDDMVESVAGRTRVQDFTISSPSESHVHVTWHQQLHSQELQSVVHRRFRQGGRLGEPHLPPYIGNSGDYLDARAFEQLLEHLAETDSSRRGAPPAAVSFVHSLPRVVINEEHMRHDGSACAICKDVLHVGTEVNQLPCLHLYHPSCILPWLNTRNSCPVCRYELPTDDQDYEEGKWNTRNRAHMHEMHHQDAIVDNFSDVSDGDDEVHEFGQAVIEQIPLPDADPGFVRGGGRRGWLFLAAAPIVSLVGIVLVLWLHNPLIEGSRSRGRFNTSEQIQHQIHIGSTAMPNQREGRRRWWSLF
ncbi:uncharacterized protein LOC119992500 isoform X1 [Tripterygium wilfordii]|uniref:uncharacterized protein LOC119992500 isoform X1 n=1 Tax=Tripterygium wilfordii TaxID=458696 RepID=UPI0018F80FD3|nr:uncharacterized protein LOC119992500 isoform X1 [Tripterygium wilfordii]